MKTKLIAKIYALLFLVTPGIAWAQIQPIPVTPANSTTFTQSGVVSISATAAYCTTVDMTGAGLSPPAA